MITRRRLLALPLTFALMATVATIPASAAGAAKSGAAKETRGVIEPVEVKSTEEAIALGKKEKKHLFMVLSSPDCSNCRLLKESLRSGEYVLSKKDFIWVSFDITVQATGRDFMDRYKPKLGIPCIVITNPEGKMIATHTGFVKKADFDRLMTAVKTAIKEDKQKAK